MGGRSLASGRVARFAPESVSLSRPQAALLLALAVVPVPLLAAGGSLVSLPQLVARAVATLAPFVSSGDSATVRLRAGTAVRISIERAPGEQAPRQARRATRVASDSTASLREPTGARQLVHVATSGGGSVGTGGSGSASHEGGGSSSSGSSGPSGPVGNGSGKGDDDDVGKGDDDEGEGDGDEGEGDDDVSTGEDDGGSSGSGSSGSGSSGSGSSGSGSSGSDDDEEEVVVLPEVLTLPVSPPEVTTLPEAPALPGSDSSGSGSSGSSGGSDSSGSGSSGSGSSGSGDDGLLGLGGL